MCIEYFPVVLLYSLISGVYAAVVILIGVFMGSVAGDYMSGGGLEYFHGVILVWRRVRILPP
jgi:hypothetical protein